MESEKFSIFSIRMSKCLLGKKVAANLSPCRCVFFLSSVIKTFTLVKKKSIPSWKKIFFLPLYLFYMDLHLPPGMIMHAGSIHAWSKEEWIPPNIRLVAPLWRIPHMLDVEQRLFPSFFFFFFPPPPAFKLKAHRIAVLLAPAERPAKAFSSPWWVLDQSDQL